MKKEKKEMSDTIRIILFSIIIIVVISLIGVSSYFLLVPQEQSENEATDINTQTIEGYGITISDSDTELYRTEYEKLRENLTSDNIDYDDYAESVAKMFIIDLYTISTKTNKYDVGGVEFVLPDGQENYITNVTDTIYNYVENNTDGKRKQNLPEVSSVTLTSTEKSTFTVESEDVEYEAYVFDMVIEYVTDYDYDKTTEVIVINKDNFMYVVEKN